MVLSFARGTPCARSAAQHEARGAAVAEAEDEAEDETKDEAEMKARKWKQTITPPLMNHMAVRFGMFPTMVRVRASFAKTSSMSSSS